MDGTWGRLKLFTPDAQRPEFDAAPAQAPQPDPVLLANRELLRPCGARSAARGLAPFSAAWYDELEQKRYQRHGAWLPRALEFGRHPGESLLLLGPGLGSDAIRYALGGTPVTVGVGPDDHPEPVRENLDRHNLPARLVEIPGPSLPFPDGTFDVVTWNALHEPARPDPTRVAELFRVLKAGGKVIGLFPAWYDAAYWQGVFLPHRWVYRRAADPSAGAGATARQLRRAFGGFTGFRVSKRQLRRSELPHLWRVLPLALLERVFGRVLVFKAFKPLSARTGVSVPLAA